jgi:Leucine-rich repeat (LRR) protein
MVLRGQWSDELLSNMRNRRVSGLELNYAKGWKGTDLSFLAQLPALTELRITDWEIEDVSPVNSLGNLRTLKVFTYCKTAIDFACFPYLEHVSLEWRPKAKSIYHCRSLKKIFINRWPGESLETFSELMNLESLELASPRIERVGRVSFPQLECLAIAYARKLDSLRGVEALGKPRMLEVNNCKKIRSIAPVAKLKNLESFRFCSNDKVKSLKPLKSLTKLREVLFYESTNVEDGDLAVLKKLPRLESIAFQQRRHYNCRWSDFPERMHRASGVMMS